MDACFFLSSLRAPRRRVEISRVYVSVGTVPHLVCIIKNATSRDSVRQIGLMLLASVEFRKVEILKFDASISKNISRKSVDKTVCLTRRGERERERELNNI